MARRPTLLKTGKRKVERKTRSEQYLVNHKYLGDEPIVASSEDSVAFGRALTWHNYMSSVDEGKKWLIEYLKSCGREVEAKQVKSVPDSAFSTTMLWTARLMQRGMEVSDSCKEFFEARLKEAIAKKQEVQQEKTETTNVISIQDRIKEKLQDIIGDIEEIIDSGVTEFSLYEHLQKKQVPAMYVTKIIDYYRPWLIELCEAHDTKDSDLKQAYRHMTKKQIEARILFFNNMISDAEKYGNVTKKTRAPRKPRAVSVEKKLKNFKYQKESSEYKIASVNPEKIIGCQELWTFNTKYKYITVFRARDRGGLQVKGTSIIDYDEKTSCTKRTGRKPEYYVDKIMNGGKIILKKIMDEAKGDAPLAYRINESTILLKVINGN